MCVCVFVFVCLFVCLFVPCRSPAEDGGAVDLRAWVGLFGSLSERSGKPGLSLAELGQVAVSLRPTSILKNAQKQPRHPELHVVFRIPTSPVGNVWSRRFFA